MCNNETSIEITSCKNLIETYHNKHENKCPFRVRTLEAAMEDTLDEHSKQVLVLFYHNPDDAFSEEFCSFISRDEIQRIIADKCYTIGWELSDENNKGLRNVIKTIFGFGTVYETLYRKQSAVFLITSSKPTVFFHMKEFLEEEVFLKSLEDALESMDVPECEGENEENEICSRKFQQIMFERLGDRDYDCFEPNEHEHLKNKLYFAVHGAPKTAKTDRDKQKIIDGIYRTILLANNKYSKWDNKIVMSFIYNCTESQEAMLRQMLPIPVFVIRKCKGGENPCRLFVDLDLRVYKSWRSYLRQNRLPKCKMTLPVNGRYRGDTQGNVSLEKHLSPQCAHSVAALHMVDKTATVIGIVSGVGMLVGIAVPPVGVVSGVIGITCALYSTTRISLQIHDRRIHFQTMSIANAEARGAYLGIAANTIGIFAGGLTRTISVVASRGVNIGKTIITSVNAVNYVSLVTDLASLVNCLNDMKSSKPGTMQIIQLTFTILFFNNTVINIGKSKGRILESEIKSLSRNANFDHRHRTTGRKEVVGELRNIHSENLTKVLNNSPTSNKFSTQNSRLLLNGISVQILKHTALNVQGLYLPPSAPNLSDTDKVNISFQLQKIFSVQSLNDITAFGVKLVDSDFDVVILGRDLLSRFPRYMHRYLLEITAKLVVKLEEEGVNFVETFKKIFKRCNYLYKIAEVIVQFLENKYELQCPQMETAVENNEKFLDMLDATFRAYVTDDEAFLMDVLQHFLNWLTTMTYEYENRCMRKDERRSNSRVKRKARCDVCGGYYYKKK